MSATMPLNILRKCVLMLCLKVLIQQVDLRLSGRDLQVLHPTQGKLPIPNLALIFYFLFWKSA